MRTPPPTTQQAELVAPRDLGGFALFRYNPDGTFDTTFGVDGIAIARGLERAQGVAIQADGKIMGAGNGEFGGFDLARYNPNGSLDTTPPITSEIEGPARPRRAGSLRRDAWPLSRSRNSSRI